MDVKKLYDDYEAYIIEMRRWFHRHPELSLKEQNTSRKIQEELQGMGIPFEVLAPNCGVAATIKGGKEGKTIALRADIDALPVKEETGLEFTSENEGVMHACGHDAHIAMMLGAAKVLNEVKEELAGTVICVFQVAEETGFGYKEVLDYFDSIGGVDSVIGLHIWSTLPEGEILLIPNSVFAGGVGYDLTVKGEGGHGGRPDLVKDPIKAACEMVLKFASIPSNFYDVLDHSVVNVGRIEAGTIGNVFPSEAKLYGGFRWYKPGGDKVILEKMHQIARGVCAMYGVDYELVINGGVPPVSNNAELISRAKGLVKDVDGLELAKQTDPICAGDNFGYILERYKGFYGVLGAEKAGDTVYPQHHCKFDLDEKAFRKGSEFMARFAIDFLNAE